MELWHVTRLALCLALCGCGSGPPSGYDAGPDGGDGDADGGAGIEIQLPVLTPCPDGWHPVPPEDPSDPYGYATCDPWPDRDPVTPPLLTPCLGGWREVPPEDPTDPLSVTTCDPWPVTGHEECDAVDEAHFAGEPGCTRIGSDCPDGEWADDLPADVRILYVRADEAEGGDGTRELPFGTIAEATDAAEPGTVIALSKGTFDEEVLLDTGVTLWGACVAETLLTCSTWSELRGTVTTRGAGTALRNVRVSGERTGVLSIGRLPAIDVLDVVVDGARGTGLAIERGTLGSVVVRDTRPRLDGTFGHGLDVGSSENSVGNVEVHRAVFERNREVGVSVFGEGTALTLTDVVVRDTQASAIDLAHGVGLEVVLGAQLEASRAVFEVNRQGGVSVLDHGSNLALSDVVVRDTRSRESDDTLGLGIFLSGGARGELSRALLERNRSGGVQADGEGTTLELTDAVVRDTQPHESDSGIGDGLVAGGEAQVVATRAVFERNRTTGVIAHGEGTTLALTDVVVRDTQADESDGAFGFGLEAGGEAQVVATRAVFDRNREVGVLATDEGTVVTLTEVVIRNTLSKQSDRDGGRGAHVQGGARLEMSRALIERNRDCGLLAMEDTTTFTLTDVVVRDTESRENDGTVGVGLALTHGARGEVLRAVLERNRVSAVLTLHDGTIVALSDVVIRDTRSQESSGLVGYGLQVAEGARAELNRAVLERNIAAAVLALDPGTSLVIADIVVRDTLENEDAWTGSGVVSLAGANVEITRFLVTRNPLCGLQLAFGSTVVLGLLVPSDISGTMDLHEGVVSDNEVCGVNLQDETFDIDRLQDRVIYLDNGTNLDMGTSIWVPEASVPDFEPPAEQ